jgi:hypothetical protein
MTLSTPYLTLPGSDQKIPQVGFGLWKVAPEAAADLVYNVSQTLFFVSFSKSNTEIFFRQLSRDTDSLTVPTITATKRRPDKAFVAR